MEKWESFFWREQWSGGKREIHILGVGLRWRDLILE